MVVHQEQFHVPELRDFAGFVQVGAGLFIVIAQAEKGGTGQEATD